MLIPIESLSAFVIASALLSVAPGPDNIFVLAQSAIYGRRSGVMVTLGLCTGLIVHTTAVALGVAAIFQTSEWAFTLLKIVGALYLGWLAWQAFRAPVESIDLDRSTQPSAGQLYRRGVVMNITNPKVSIFFLAFLPQFAAPESGSMVMQLFLLGGVFIVVALVVFSMIAALAGVLGAKLRRSPRVQLYLSRIAGVVFAGLALKLVTSGVKS